MAKEKKIVAWWLLLGVVMIFFQIVIGGITRLTGSGLSITKWEIVTGAVPPLNEAAWNTEFEHYKATPQYHKLNHGMSLAEFKFIYFWEYFHRLWARLMGFVFAIPFAVFLFQKKLSSSLIKQLLVLILLAALVASFGWIMVKSGLVNRPWVDAYKLTLHLSLALVTYGYLVWLFLSQFFEKKNFTIYPALKKFAVSLLFLLCFQLVLGGLMSGMHAGLLYPTFPDMHGQFIPDVLLTASNWTSASFLHYDTDPFAPTLIQFLHRGTAYLFFVLTLIFFFRSKKYSLNHPLPLMMNMLTFLVSLQVLLGILTVLHFTGETPVLLGVLHQATAILLLSALIGVNFLLRKQDVKGAG